MLCEGQQVKLFNYGVSPIFLSGGKKIINTDFSKVHILKNAKSAEKVFTLVGWLASWLASQLADWLVGWSILLTTLQVG